MRKLFVTILLATTVRLSHAEDYDTLPIRKDDILSVDVSNKLLAGRPFGRMIL